jgi:hypothetical protein
MAWKIARGYLICALVIVCLIGAGVGAGAISYHVGYGRGQSAERVDESRRLDSERSKLETELATANSKIASLTEQRKTDEQRVRSAISSLNTNVAKSISSGASQIDIVEEIRYYSAVATGEIQDWYNNGNSGSGSGNSAGDISTGKEIKK